MRWNPEITIGNFLTFAGLIATAIGLLFTAWQLKNGIRIQRAQFLLQTSERYFKDADIRKLYYDIDYDRLEFRFSNGEPNEFSRNNQNFKPFFGSEEERFLDTLLYTFDVIARVAEIQAMSEKESQLYAFQAARVFRNKHIVHYLGWLDNERERFGGEVPSHNAARIFVNKIKPE